MQTGDGSTLDVEINTLMLGFIDLNYESLNYIPHLYVLYYNIAL
jgi:hypothetical protein